MNQWLISLKLMENDLVAAHENARKHSECIDTDQIRKYVRDLYSIDSIEDALKEYEVEHILRVRLENINYKLVRENEDNKKKLKALEIIKEKGIILQFIKETYTVEQYNAGVFGTLVKPLTQEEYDLLKEVLVYAN